MWPLDDTVHLISTHPLQAMEIRLLFGQDRHLLLVWSFHSYFIFSLLIATTCVSQISALSHIVPGHQDGSWSTSLNNRELVQSQSLVLDQSSYGSPYTFTSRYYNDISCLTMSNSLFPAVGRSCDNFHSTETIHFLLVQEPVLSPSVNGSGSIYFFIQSWLTLVVPLLL
jgi:hypothetical protein